jgi:hypothetical protein
MKQTLLIIIIFIGLGNVNAQSDATWEETTDFILKYADTYFRFDAMIGRDKLPERLYKFKIVNKKLLFKYENWDYSIDLSKLKKVNKNENRLMITLTGQYIVRDYNDGSTPGINASFHFAILDSDMLERMYKSFSHLTELATKQREATRKVSGDKF